MVKPDLSTAGVNTSARSLVLTVTSDMVVVAHGTKRGRSNVQLGEGNATHVVAKIISQKYVMHFVKHEECSAHVNKPTTQPESNVEYNQTLYHTRANRTTKHVKPYMFAIVLNNVPTMMEKLAQMSRSSVQGNLNKFNKVVNSCS